LLRLRQDGGRGADTRILRTTRPAPPPPRQLNRALHIIAITCGKIDPTTRAYLQRKEAEGKTRIEAMRCLSESMRIVTISRMTS
jgi:hypothetical protein